MRFFTKIRIFIATLLVKDIVTKHRIPIIIEVQNGVSAFGAYGVGSVTDGTGRVLLNLTACSGVSPYDEEDFKQVVSETLAHEIIHAIQEKFGLLFSESVIQYAIANPDDLESCEDSEQMIQELTRDVNYLQIEKQLLHDVLANIDEISFDREFLGEQVREAWIQWAKTQPEPKPSWLVPYAELNEADKEADRQIGERIVSIFWDKIAEVRRNTQVSSLS